ncbi:MAG: hypothetical protein GDA39_08700 [Hyphomonadaceae bacterium]|nr:hypothetical protein [Hyphomonadaceae bacterium]MBC6412931.1 hypothetical protein [Hyphomonadaceae bacterium]
MMIVFLPPAPHTGAFFDSVRKRLPEFVSGAATYAGYGNRPRTRVSIEAYAEQLLPVEPGTTLLGFHTGCLVALEMAARQADVGKPVLVDIPFFDEATREKYAAGLDPDDPTQDAFRAAFAYDAETALARCRHEVTVIATQSSLFEPTVKAAEILKHAHLITREDIEKPVFESKAMAALLREIFLDAI